MFIDEVNKIKSVQNITDYSAYLDDVIDWNRTCEAEPPTLEKQMRLVKEEAAELFEAFDEGNIQNFFKELCDLFVTAGYASVVKYNETTATTCYQDDIEYILSCIEDIVFEGNAVRAFDLTLQLMNSVNQEALHKTMNAVLRSNWSKIFPVGEADDELRFAKVGYLGRYEGIYVQHKESGCVLKDKNGKVLKPSSYKSYEEYL